jgi:hypothetical protein
VKIPKFFRKFIKRVFLSNRLKGEEKKFHIKLLKNLFKQGISILEITDLTLPSLEQIKVTIFKFDNYKTVLSFDKKVITLENSNGVSLTMVYDFIEVKK